MNDTVHLSRQELTDTLRRLDLWSEETDWAFDLAEEVHASQQRAGRRPYLEEHVYPVTASVAEYLSMKGSDRAPETVLVALLHDTVEDSDTIDDDVIRRRFGTSVADGVAVLTKPEKRPGNADPDSKEAEDRYVAGVAGADWNVRVVKVMDRLNNLTAVHERPRDRRENYLEETRRHFLDLAQSVDPKLAEHMSTLLRDQERRFHKEFGDCPH